MSNQKILEESKIYGKGKGSNVKLTNWQKEVNHAAFSICLQSNDMSVYDRAKLKLDAEEMARKTYVFQKKGGSRSVFDTGPVPKRHCISTDEWQKQIASVSQTPEEMTKHVAVKQKLITQSNNSRDYQLCDKSHQQLRELMQEKQKMESRLNELLKKKKKHHGYVSKTVTNQQKNPVLGAKSNTEQAIVVRESLEENLIDSNEGHQQSHIAW